MDVSIHQVNAVKAAVTTLPNCNSRVLELEVVTNRGERVTLNLFSMGSVDVTALLQRALLQMEATTI